MMRVIDRAANAFLALLGLALIAMIGLTICNVISRYVFNRALLWADEATVFAMIALAFLGAVVCGWRKAEIRMDIFANLLPSGAQRLLDILQQAVMAGLCGWVAWQSVGYVRRAYAIGMRGDASGLPTWIVHALIPLSLFLIALIAAVRCIRLIASQDFGFGQARTGKESIE